MCIFLTSLDATQTPLTKKCLASRGAKTIVKVSCFHTYVQTHGKNMCVFIGVKKQQHRKTQVTVCNCRQRNTGKQTTDTQNEEAQNRGAH